MPTIRRTDLSTGKPATGLALGFFLLKPHERVAFIERFLAENHGARLRTIRRKLRTMTPDDVCFANWTHYVAVIPGVLRRHRAALVVARRVVARQAQQRQAR